MKKIEHVLVVIKPDGMSQGLTGIIISRFFEVKLEMTAVKLLQVSRQLAEKHYRHIHGKPFYQMTLEHMLGKGYNDKRMLAIIYRGEKAIQKARDLIGSTNPEEAEPTSIRGMYGGVAANGVFENIIHASSDKREAEREIKLWFEPDEIPISIYPTKQITIQSVRKRMWV